jgi:threonine synthase
MMRQMLKDTGEILDPHTAVGVHVARPMIGSEPMVTLATAHPAKFPDAVEKATGLRPGLPHRLKHLLELEESFTVLPNSAAAVKDMILSAKER